MAKIRTMAPRLLFVFMVVLLMLERSHATPTTISTPTVESNPLRSTPTYDDDPKWICPEVSAQANATIQQVMGDWWVLELEGSPPANTKDSCSKLSMTDLKDEGGNSSSVTFSLYWPWANGTRKVEIRKSAYFLNHKANEFVIGDLNSVVRLHHLSADGRVFVLAACNIRQSDRVYWITFGLAQDDLPVHLPHRSANSVLRDANRCRELELEEEEGESKTYSNF